MRVLAFRISALGVALTALACGPAIELEGDATTGGDGGTLEPTSGDAPPSVSTSGPTPPPPPGTATAPPPGTSTVTSATTASTGDSDTWDTGDDCGCNFLCDPCWDGCRNEPIPGCDGDGLECDLFAQDCPEGEKCMPWANDGGAAWNSLRCSPLDDAPGQAGDACTVEGSGVSGVDDCDAGLMCWNVDENGQGSCVPMCTGSADAPLCDDPADTCVIANDGVLNLCLPACDPLLQDCDEGSACYGAGTSFACAPDASGPDLGLYGDACEYTNACDPGLFCAAAGAVPGCEGSLGCCSEFCDLDAPNPDGACGGSALGQICEPWFAEGAAPPGYDNLGACVLPQ